MVELGQCQLAHIPLDAGCGPESVEKQEFRWEIGTKRRMGEGWGRRLNGAGSKPHSTSSLFLGWIPPSPKGYCEDDESQKASSWSDVASDLGWILWALEWNRPGFESSSVIPKDGGAWWAAVYGVTHSRTQLKRLSSSSIYKSASMGIVGSIYQRTQEKYHPLVHWVIVIHTSNSPNYRHYSGLWTRSSPSWPWSGSPGNSGLFYVIRHRWKGLSGCSEVQQKSFSTPLGQK